MPSPSETVAARVKELRKRHRWTQADLAGHLAHLGYPVDPTVITRLERGERGVSLDDALAIAYALGVSPLYLVFPVTEGAEIEITSKTTVDARDARRWTRGETPLEGQNEETFFELVSDEKAAAGRRSRETFQRLIDLDRRLYAVRAEYNQMHEIAGEAPPEMEERLRQAEADYKQAWLDHMAAADAYNGAR